MFTLRTKWSMIKAVLTKNSPFYIQFYVSKFCTFNCKMCNIVEANADTTPFPKEQIKNIANNLVKIGAGVILLTGGEPFLRPDIDVIVKEFKSRGLDVRLQTNGYKTNRGRIESCVKNGARDISISLDSLDAELFDYINSRKGFYEIMKTVSFVSKTFPQKDSICAFGCVLSKYNIDEIIPIIDFATRIGWFVSLVPAHITEPDTPLNFRGYDNYFKFPEEDFPKVKALITKLKKMKRQGYNLFDSDDYLDSIYDFIKTGKPSWRHNDVCDSPNIYFAILPDGKFAPCCDHRFPKDIFVYDKKFPKIYNNKMFRKDVRKITTKCPGCNFGSYPEMTLSARSFSTLKERLYLQWKTKFVGIKALSEDQLLEILNDVKSKYKIYSEPRDFPFRKTKKWPIASNVPSQLWQK